MELYSQAARLRSEFREHVEGVMAFEEAREEAQRLYDTMVALAIWEDEGGPAGLYDEALAEYLSED
jgi:hypothetical protein